MSRRARLDAELVRRGLARSREHAADLVAAGHVTVPGRATVKPATQVDAGEAIQVNEDESERYVSRGGHKLAGALDVFEPRGLLVAGRRCLDAGASTGGFTDVLLRRGAESVVALDVGHGQLDWKLRNDPRVVVLERTNARTLTPEQLPEHARHFALITVDVSFISLRQILPVVPAVLEPGGDVIALVKPQFEAGRAEVGKGGIVRDAEVQQRVVEAVGAAAGELGLIRAGMVESPITGMEGNREFLLHLRGA